MKIKAWTLVEMAIAIIIITILSSISISKLKPNDQKAKVYVYAAIRNIMQGNIAVVEKFGALDAQETVNGNNWHCIQVADTFSLKDAPVCSSGSTASTVNLTFSNGTTIQGLTNPWVLPYTDAPYKVKNIVIDIDGSAGLNKVWADRFPLRIIGGKGKGAESVIVPVDCGTEKVYNINTSSLVNIANAAKNPYCKQGFNATGTAVTKNFTLDNSIIAYNIYKAESVDENAKGELIAGGLSFFEADCMSQGSSMGYFSVSECNSAKVRIATPCATTLNCSSCLTYSCPNDIAGSATSSATCATMLSSVNPDNIPCFTLMNKPGGSASLIMQSLIGDIDEI